MNNNNDSLPRDAKVLIAILNSMGINEGEYDPKILPQLLEFMFRYTSDVLNDSVSYASHASRDKIILDDVKLAIKTQLNYSFVQPTPRDVIAEIAADRNDHVIPIIPTRAGVLLPRDELCLTNPNYQVEPEPESMNNNNNNNNNNRNNMTTYISNKQSYSANRKATTTIDIQLNKQ